MIKLKPSITAEQKLQDFFDKNPDCVVLVCSHLRKQLDYNAQPEVHADKQCPVCSEPAQWLRRNINKRQAESLANLHNISERGEFKHITEFVPKKGVGDEFSKLRFFGLVVPQAHNDDPSKTHAGMWSITDLGREFVKGRATVVKYVWVYRSVVQRKEGPQVGIRDCLGKKFDIRETRPGHFEVQKRQ